MTKITATVAAVNAVLAALVLTSILHLTADQLAGINLAVSAVLGAVVAWFDPKVPVGNGKT